MTHRIQASVLSACRSLMSSAVDPSWLSQWQTLDERVSSYIEQQIRLSWTESNATHALAEWIDGPFFLGSSMPIREANWFLFPNRADAFFCNRGLSGIDGNIATAVGVAEGLQRPLVVLLGDLTALHDLNSLSLLQTASQPVKLVISNNGGGGIFSHLAVAKDPRFEELFAFEHALSFEHVARMFSLPYEAVRSEEELVQAMQRPGTVLVELFTSRKENILFHKNLLASLAQKQNYDKLLLQ
jgi:2-succinyl-5-enolpyruvyl-6-hydroxy-3-cyclohexene-1-carboxylate synthase